MKWDRAPKRERVGERRMAAVVNVVEPLRRTEAVRSGFEDHTQLFEAIVPFVLESVM